MIERDPEGAIRRRNAATQKVHLLAALRKLPQGRPPLPVGPSSTVF